MLRSVLPLKRISYQVFVVPDFKAVEWNGAEWCFIQCMSWSPLPLPLVWENRFISRVLVEKGIATRDPQADALEAGGECFVLWILSECSEKQSLKVGVVCPVVHGTRFGSVSCCVSGSGFLEQLGGHFLLGISRRPWKNLLIASCLPWCFSPLPVIIPFTAYDSSPPFLPGDSVTSFCQAFWSWQCWELDFSHVSSCQQHWQHQIPGS